MKNILMMGIVLSLMLSVSAMQYIGINRLCILNSTNNQTCLDGAGEYNFTINNSYIVSTYDAHQTPSGAHALSLSTTILTILGGVFLLGVVFIILGYVIPK